jgi:O-antigen ligase
MSVRTIQPAVLELEGDDKRLARILDTALLYGMLAVLMFGILAFGGAQAWAVATLEVASALLFVLWAIRRYTAAENRVPSNPLLAPAAAFALLIAAQLVLRTTAYPNATWHEAMRYIAYGMLFLVAQHCFQKPWLRRRFLYILAFFGAAVALEAVVQNLTSPDKIYWYWPVPLSGSIYGPYASHGHYAGMMEMLAPIPLVLAMNSARNAASRALLIFAGTFMGATVFLSHSRGGMIAFAVEMLFLLWLAWSQRKHGRVALIVLAAIAGVALLVVAFAPAQLAISLRSLREPLDPHVNGDRITIARDTVRMFRERPIAGWGLETFPVVYPRFRSFPTTYFINEAHNDYVQMLAETGILGFGAMLAFLVLLYRVGLRNVRAGDGPLGSSSATAALVGCTGLLAHGVSDFNLHIPANAALFFVLCALATYSPASKQGSVKLYRMTRPDRAFTN